MLLDAEEAARRLREVGLLLSELLVWDFDFDVWDSLLNLSSVLDLILELMLDFIDVDS